MKEFKEHIKENFGALTNEEIEILQSFFYEEELTKNEFFTQTDKYCNKLSLVKSGLLRIYRLSDGKEITQWISTPNYFVTEISSFFFDQPSRLSIQALTNVELLTIDKKSYSELNKKLPKWKEIETQFIAKCFAVLEDRVFSHLSMSAEERYNVYFEQNKELFNQVPLQYIASILGMSAETFSRIRKRKAENS
ncbi:Crp/Fnr family transcriptional regulator [Empedobacter brevis]|uniref:Crp/Fnr family transcriptional regulator n=1 Tax=Empedobacter brevis TaxID=247 RepID=UPI0028A186FE|nr:Crp/Fnr family transcriptional regulator [Empedobacter brevis]